MGGGAVEGNEGISLPKWDLSCWQRLDRPTRQRRRRAGAAERAAREGVAV
jgi:hypothetical protein